MNRFLGMVAVTFATLAGAPAGADPITQDAAIFAVVDHIDNDRMSLSLLHSIMSEDADMETILFVGDHLDAERIFPPYSSGREHWCVTAIRPQQRQGRPMILPWSRSREDSRCYAVLHNHRGRAGLDAPVLEEVVRVMLTGDLVFVEGSSDEVDKR